MNPVRSHWQSSTRFFIAVMLVMTFFTGVANPASSYAASSGIVISQVYGGGGNTGAPYTHDFIELFNRGTAPVSLAGWSLQYASATGTGSLGANASQLTELPAVTLQPGQYFLVQEASGGTVGAALSSPDLIDSTPINMSATAGKVALASIATSLGCNGGSTPCNDAQLANIVDLVGFGTANFYEVAVAAAPSNTTALFRGGNGCVETDNNSADFSVAAPAPRNTTTALAACAIVDTAPTVSSVLPSNAATNVPPTSTITVSFSEPVTVATNAFSLLCNSTAQALTVTGGPDSYTLTPTAALADGASCTLTITAAAVTDQDGAPDPMAADLISSFTVATPVVCAAVDTPIGQVQGEGNAAAISSSVTIQGVVIGDYEGVAPALRGFYIQDTGDSNPLSSDAIFVFNGNNNSVNLGQVVQVTGTPAEFQGQTQLGGTLTIETCGAEATVVPIDLMLPFPAAVNGVPFEERYEGMLVRMAQKLYVTEHFQLGRFGQVVLSANSRLMQPSNVVMPGADAIALQAANNLNRIIVDDATQLQNPDPIVFGRNGQPLSASNTLRGGDSVENLVGVLTYTWGGNAASPNAYRMRPLQALGGSVPNFVADNPRPTAAPAVGGRVKVVAINVLNYFLTLDIGTTPACGPIGNKQECRGAETAIELERQQQKLNQALLSLDADIIGMMELENSQDANGNDVNPLADIVARLNASAGAGTYDYINTGIIGTDTIRVGLIYKPGKVQPLGAFQTLDSNDDPRFDTSRNRPSLAQSFEEVGLDTRFTVVVNHFKSKGSCPAFGDPNADQGDGQSCWNPVRVAAAAALVDWVATDPTSSGDADFLLLGDFNSYAMEDPIRTVLAGSDDAAQTGDDFVNLVLRFGAEAAYSYVFDGQWGYLDHALASNGLNAQVVGTAEYHINSDEPSVLDYNTNFKTAGQVSSLYAPDQYRISDHDPVVIGLDLADTSAPSVTASVTGSVRAGCAADCYDGSATVTLNMSEPGSIVYRINGGDAQSYTAPFVVSTEGSNTIEFYATDLAGNSSDIQLLTVKVTHYPVLAVVDDFNRRNGGLGRNWGVLYADAYTINSNQGLVGVGGPAYYRGTANGGPIFGANQAAALTLVNPVGLDQGILLKVQPQGSGAIGTYRYQNGTIEVWYNSATGLVTIATYERNVGWRDLASFAATVQPGSVLGAVALDDGTIKAYVNCELIGQVNTPFLANKGGLTGIWYENASGAGFDNFQAGTIVP